MTRTRSAAGTGISRRALLAGAALGLAGCSAHRDGADAAPGGVPVTGAAGGDVPPDGRHGLWLGYGRSPGEADLAAAAGRVGVAILNLWETAAARRLKELAPSVVVLAYQDLSSVRDYDLGPTPPAGIGWQQALTRPEWFARDTDGRRIEWSGYPGHWQTAVWDPGYRAAWVANVTGRLTGSVWDGVFADNDLASLTWYADAVLAGTDGRDATDRRLRDGLDALVATAGRAVRDAGKLFVPNVAEARLHPGRWADHARWGGGLDESFAHFGTGTGDDSFVSGDAWRAQSAEAAGPGLSLLVTPSRPHGGAALRYGYATALVAGGRGTYWQPAAAPAGYTGPQSIAEQAWPTGGPAQDARADGDALTRRWERVWAAVNPGSGTATLRPPAGAADSSGTVRDTVRLAPGDGVVLRLPDGA